MLRLLRFFFGIKGANPWMVLLCVLAASLAQGFGIASLVPLISIVGDEGTVPSSLASRTVVDALHALGLRPDLGILLLVVVFAAILKATLTLIAMVYVARAVAQVAGGLRSQLLKALLSARWSYFTSKQTGMLVNAIGLESTISGNVFLMVSRFLTSAIQAVIYIGVAFAVSWQLATGSLVVGGLIVLALDVFVRRAEKAGRRGIKRSRELVTGLSDAIIGIKPLKAMAREGDFGRLFQGQIDQIRDATRREIISKNMQNHLQEPLLLIMLATGFYILVTHFDMAVATVLVMGVLLQRTVGAIGKLQSQYQEAVAAESAYHSVRGLTDEAEQQREVAHGVKPPSLSRACRFCNVTFGYGTVPILRDLSFDIPVRRLTLIVGASGTGKTTLTDLILGFYHPSQGEILIDDVPLSEIDIRAWRRNLGYVPQDLSLLHDTIFANITLGDPSLDEAMVAEAIRLAGAEPFIQQLPDGLMTSVGEKGSRFSGGQRQRIAIARALVHRPQLLILDEVTSALDAATEQDICANIRDIARSFTVLAISHRQAWLDIADHTIHLEPVDANDVETENV
jgi:ATP-binding cassette subfamily C protein